MLKSTLLNSDILSVLSRMGHTDTLVIADCGLPIPNHVQRIDLTLRQGVPSFQEVFELITSEMAIEQMTIAKEIETNNPELARYFQQHHEKLLNYVSHEDFKAQTHQARAIIRTGENTPFANVILHADVIF